MIKTLRLRNFKAFQDTGEIEIKPITVLAGPNSGGKSSILHSLLLLKQTVETETPEPDLNLDGRFLQFSRFDELVFGKPSLERCNIIYEIGFETKIPTQVVPAYYPDLPIPEDSDNLPLQNHMEFSFRYKEAEDGKRRVILNSLDILSQIHNELGPRLTCTFRKKKYQVKLRGKGIKLPKPYQKRKIKDMASTHFLPVYLVLEPDPEESESSPILIRLDQIFFNPLMGLEEEFKNHLKYLGPLREEPKRAYLHSGSPFPEIGEKGQYAAQILWLERDSKVQYLTSLDAEPQEFLLQSAVSHAFQNLQINQPINVRSEDSIVYQILFGLMGSEGKKRVTIADVGFGVSQLLPVVLMGVRSGKSSLLLFEQPEIHLHPKLQANLADFFLRMALLGKRIIVETHSDHLINRLRRRIAEDPTDELKDKINILFVHPPHDGEGATIEPLKIDRYGIIENWPPDFLPESADEAEAILTAGLEKRKG